jgi:hypothetical protein
MKFFEILKSQYKFDQELFRCALGVSDLILFKNFIIIRINFIEYSNIEYTIPTSSACTPRMRLESSFTPPVSTRPYLFGTE